MQAVEQWGTPRVRGERRVAGRQDVVACLLLVVCAAVMTRSFWLDAGVPVFGDWVPPARSYIGHVVAIWNPFERNGTLNVDLRIAPWVSGLMYASGDVGSRQFAVISNGFTALVIVAPMFVLYVLLRRRFDVSPAAAAAASLVYGCNPWYAGQVASGHIGTVLGFSLLPPVAALAFSRAGTGQFVVVGAALFAASASVDLHTALVVGITLVVGRVAMCGVRWRTLGSLAGLGAATTGLAGYWLVPSVLAARLIDYSPVGLAPSRAAQARLAQLADPIHVFTGRSNWWVPYSDDFYRYGSEWIHWVLVVGMLLLPADLLRRIAFRQLQSWRLGLAAGVLLVVGVVPQLFAHWWPGEYLVLGTLPFGALFRDVTHWTPLYILGLGIVAVRLRPPDVWFKVVALVACVAYLSPWISGNLRGEIGPVEVDDGQLEAIQFLNASSRRDDVALWLPTDLYAKYSWSPNLVTDVPRFWSRQPILNPVGDAAYDLLPEATESLINLNALMTAPQAAATLAPLFRHIGVRWVVVRTSVESGITVPHLAVLRASRGLSIERTFKSVIVFRVDGAVRPRAQLVDRATLFGGSWTGLSHATELDPELAGTYLPWRSLRRDPRLLDDPRVSALVDGTLWDAVLGQFSLALPPGAGSRERYGFDPGVGYAFEAGEEVAFRSRGIAVVRLLAARELVHFTCASEDEDAGLPNVVTNEARPLGPSWFAIECDGVARLAFESRGFLQGFASLTQRDLFAALDRVHALFLKGSSSYVLRASELRGGLATFPAEATQPSMGSFHENPLMLPLGYYRITFQCHAVCPRSTVSLTPFQATEWAGELGQAYMAHRPGAGQRVDVDMITAGTSATADLPVAGGIYQALLTTTDVNLVRSIAIQRLPLVSLDPPVPSRDSSEFGRAHFVSLRQAAGPFDIRRADGRPGVLLPADMVGSTFGAGNQTSTLTDASMRRIQLIGIAITLLTAAVLLAIRQRARAGRGRPA